MFAHGEEKEQKGQVLGNDGFTGSFGKRFLQRVKRFRIEEEGNDKE